MREVGSVLDRPVPIHSVAPEVLGSGVGARGVGDQIFVDDVREFLDPLRGENSVSGGR